MKIPTLFTVFLALGLATEGILAVIPQIPIICYIYNWAICCVISSIFYEYLPRKTFFALMFVLSSAFLITALEWFIGGLFLTEDFILLIPIIYVLDIAGTIGANKTLHYYKVFERMGYKTTIKGFNKTLAIICLSATICISIGSAQLWYGINNFHQALGTYGIWNQNKMGISGTWFEAYQTVEAAALQCNGILLGIGIGIILTLIALLIKNKIKDA